MKRYIVRPRGLDDDWTFRAMPAGASITVYEPERTPQKTGLLDKHGNEFVRREK